MLNFSDNFILKLRDLFRIGQQSPSMKKILLYFIFLLGSFVSHAQDLSVFRTTITGKKSRKWIEVAWKESMGNKDRAQCNGGKSYQFFENEDLLIWECINGIRTVTKRTKWKLKSSDATGRPIIQVDGKDFLALVQNTTNQSVIRMRLRENVESKSVPAIVIDLNYEVD